jgi:GTP-binding protein
MKTPLVALIGRPNVGKSSLFNRFLKRKLAIVDDKPGITRDRNYALCDWNGRQFYLIDTGGMLPGAKTAIGRMVLEQSEIAVEQADLIVLIVDNKTGPDEIDESISRLLHKTDKNILLFANKADGEYEEADIYQFMNLGLGNPLPVSATGGRGIGEALDAIADLLPDFNADKIANETVRIAVVGRPNAGKSLFINRLIGQDRVIVSDVPGTTRDSVDTPFEFEGRNYILVDTAGLRRKSRVKEDIEYYTTLRTLRAIEDCDVVLVLIDAERGMAFQDLKIIEDAVAARRAIVLAINKWDLVEKDDKTADKFTLEIKDQAKTFSFIPIIFISSLTGQRVTKAISYIDRVYANWHRRIQTSELNNFLEEIIQKQPPAAVQGKYIKFFYGTQTEIKPPTLVFFCNYPQLLRKSYLRYIENRLRERYDFEGVPFRIKIKKRKS